LQERQRDAAVVVGPGGTFTVVLLLADTSAQNVVLRWREHGDETGESPGMKIDALEDVHILDVVTGHVICRSSDLLLGGASHSRRSDVGHSKIPAGFG
jgi:hypothetical protein